MSRLGLRNCTVLGVLLNPSIEAILFSSHLTLNIPSFRPNINAPPRAIPPKTNLLLVISLLLGVCNVFPLAKEEKIPPKNCRLVWISCGTVPCLASLLLSALESLRCIKN